MTPIYRPLDMTDLEPSFALASACFASSSTVHRALGIDVDEYRAYLRPSFELMLGQGLSYGAFAPDTGAILGCVIVTDYAVDLGYSAAENPKFAPLVALMRQIEHDYATHRQLGAGEAILIDMAAVDEAAQGLGVYAKLRAHVHAYAKAQGFNWVIGELSSAATQHVVIDKMGHRAVTEIAIETFEWQGQYPFASVKEPKALVLSEGVL